MPTFLPIEGSNRQLQPHSRPAGPVDPNVLTSLTIRVRSRGDLARLEKKVYDLANTPLAERVYLTHDELEAGYGAVPEDFDAIERYAQQHDLRVSHRSAIERRIVLKGKLKNVLAAFPADVQLYHSPMGTYRGRKGDVSLPGELAEIVTGVFGLDTRPKNRSPYRQRSLSQAGPGGGNGVAATHFASRYNFPSEAGGARLDGKDQTIAIIELGGGFRNSDLTAFFKEIGSPTPNVTSVSVDHVANDPSNANSADGEVMLDIEVAGAVVPGAKLVVYFGPNEGDKGFLDTISAAVHDKSRSPSVISISWGSPEVLNDKSGIDAYHELFMAAGALGITICVASGDHGTADAQAEGWDGQIHVDHPSCDPLVLSCGGTQIDGDEDVVWNDGTPLGGGGWATGGGVSIAFPTPDYQRDSNVPASLITGKAGRGVPDIAMSATNYFTRVDTYEGPSGGTSAVAPLMAALVARLNQATGRRVGFANPSFYKAATQGAFRDVVSGTNAIADTVKGYDAGPGWDACSGLGTPDGQLLLAQIVK